MPLGQKCPICGHKRRCKYDVAQPDNLRLCFRESTETVNGFRRVRPARNGCATYVRIGSPADGNGGATQRPDWTPTTPPTDLEALTEQYKRAITTTQVDALAASLSVSADALRALDVGHDGRDYCLPERDAEGHVVGIVRRLASGKQLSIKGHRRGLAIPRNLEDLPDPVLVVEGHSDVAACLTLKLTAVGRPSSLSGAEPLAKLLDQREVIVVGENDRKQDGQWPGRDGATAIAKKLAEAWGQPVAWSLPSAGAKDIRDHLCQHVDGDPRAVGQALLAELQKSRAWEPGAAENAIAQTGGGYSLSDEGNAERFAARYGDRICYCVNTQGQAALGWLVFDGVCWQRAPLAAQLLVRDTVRGMYAEASKLEDADDRAELAKHAASCERLRRQQDMLEASKKHLFKQVANFDANPYAITLANGTLDLKSNKLEPHNPDHRITKRARAAYHPGQHSDVWQSFVNTLQSHDAEMISFIQRACGYCLCGDTSEKCFFIPYGVTDTGKSTFIEAIRFVMGDYAVAVPPSTFMMKGGDSIPNDRAMLRGARLVTCVETNEGQRLDESFVKNLTGGVDVLTARFMRAEFFEFKPECKVWLATNHKPTIRGTDDALWNRVYLIPFENRIPVADQDKSLSEKLSCERDAILAWMVNGFWQWQERGLDPPDKVKIAVDKYRTDSNIVGQFFDECLDMVAGFEVSNTEMAIAYKLWCRDSNERPLDKRWLGRRITALGIEQRKSGGRRLWCGVRLKSYWESRVVNEQ